MTKWIVGISFLVLILLQISCETPNSAGGGGTVVTHSFRASSLEGNLLGDSPERNVQVYLPPGYGENPERRYATIYFLMGFGANADQYFNYYDRNGQILGQMIEAGQIEPCIIVSIDGNNRFGGSFYVNSPVSGNWEDYIVEVVGQVDANFRTLAQRESRGLTGFSMGGFGSVYVGLRNAGLFNVVHAYSPGLFGENGFDSSVWETWSNWSDVLLAYGSAFTPHSNPLDGNSFYFPNQNLSNSEIMEHWNQRWSHGYGEMEIKVDAYLAETHRLAHIQIDYAENDDFVWLREGSRYLFQVLQNRGIPSGQRVVPGYAHHIDSRVLQNYLYPIFAEHLVMQ